MDTKPQPIDKSDKGILKAAAGRQKFSLTRFEPAPELASLIEQYWVVRWNLAGQEPYRQVILSYPNVNLSFEREHTGIFTGVYGIPEKTYTRTLQGEGVVLGVKFRPGGFYPFYRQPVSQLNGRILPAKEALGIDTAALEAQIFAQASDAEMAALAEEFLRGLKPVADENAELASRIVQSAIDNRDMTKVDDMAARFGLNVRTLQRLFSRYVGVSPKWVIHRYRLQEAAELMEKGGETDWAQLAAELGFYDQAHFIKSFKAMIGKSPEEYRRETGGLA